MEELSADHSSGGFRFLGLGFLRYASRIPLSSVGSPVGISSYFSNLIGRESRQCGFYD